MTANKLIIFADGSYIELIAFIDDDPTKQDGHWWNPAEKGYGIVDYAFTLPNSNDADAATTFNQLRDRILRLDIPEPWKPQTLRSGSRRKPSGELIEWHVSFPQAEARGRAPFWCFDVTPRERRVPANDPAATTHPNGARGVAELTIFNDGVEGDANAPSKRLFDEILPTVAVEGNSWQLSSPRKNDEANTATSCRIRIDDAQNTVTDGLKRRPLVARVELYDGNGRRILLEVKAPDDPR
ncbi:MAG: hypothetical protein Q9160_003184 [Pyrenula sp. 1 TL-2023]